MKAKQKMMLIVLLFAVILGGMGVPLNVHAAEATVTFGSNWYNKSSGDTFPVGVYLKAGAAIGDYHIEIKYDRLRLQYVEGADDADEENGVLILDGNQNGRELKFWIQFKAISGGEALIEISAAEVKLRNSEEGESFNITAYDSAPVHIKGEDTAAQAEGSSGQEASQAGSAPEGQEAPQAGTAPKGQEASQAGTAPEGQEASQAGAASEGQEASQAGAASEGQEASQNGTAQRAEGGQREPEGQAGAEHVSETGIGESQQRGSGTRDGNSGSDEGNDGESAGADTDRESSYGVGNSERDTIETVGKEPGNEVGTDTGSHGTVRKEKRNYIFFNVYFVFALAAILLIVVVDVAVWNIIKKVRAKRRRGTEEQEETSDSRKNGNHIQEKDKLDFIDLDIEEQENRESIPTVDLVLEGKNAAYKPNGNTPATADSVKSSVVKTGGGHEDDIFMTSEEELEWQYGRPIIKVCDLTMEFKLYSVNPSGLKEYVVQLLKREVSYRRLYALYHVSFNVYKGEVIGIIGTNGSGKSTLLKIVSGALKPTEGHVEIVGHRKVQLLTLGTGFDMELTARENVFLNGSIIGYSREFLETHYDEIVEFAELQDFMEEKVKNFSSGMVSRLGFAIATAGEAAEILILDEILSVGDEFFRQKSLKRIKEMIHGGSTVLMVSHSMGTILENCSRCVWIEKGELKMAGEPKVVCEAYRRLNG